MKEMENSYIINNSHLGYTSLIKTETFISYIENQIAFYKAERETLKILIRDEQDNNFVSPLEFYCKRKLQEINAYLGYLENFYSDLLIESCKDLNEAKKEKEDNTNEKNNK